MKYSFSKYHVYLGDCLSVYYITQVLVKQKWCQSAWFKYSSYNNIIETMIEVSLLGVVVIYGLYMVIFATMENFERGPKFSMWRGFAATKDRGILRIE